MDKSSVVEDENAAVMWPSSGGQAGKQNSAAAANDVSH